MIQVYPFDFMFNGDYRERPEDIEIEHLIYRANEEEKKLKESIDSETSIWSVLQNKKQPIEFDEEYYQSVMSNDGPGW